ncbi:pantoate--beta-alanine ligase [Breznakibacter xylanolyticus]|uniref:Pantothenate synthetase n=1 Tax=Breznakibacter xylanolyticus TaxID=990 RepID=A0A2W7P246_9BACT|nr:pantoate--beta-alanine ligase [Breznakibacter xylanolyticus]MBN2743191.1 pantoate--beta-alanine ligase [Marinilabiliaceae bacterium]PZX19506.1 pantoate--beta-alanine ligase [Breznakibacter xylanolyticus]
MIVVKTVGELQNVVKEHRQGGARIGFVPTMGALHAGHLSLVDEAARSCDLVVVSIFVNPTQFNNAADLENYPRTLDRDVALLSGTACRLVFAPSVAEMYPEPDTRVFDFGELDKVMEGKHRPGHFNGVAQVVSRLFDMVRPDMAFFGQKDFQQLAIIVQLVKQLQLPVQIVPCPIIREADGLAMSSRNTLLTPEQRKIVPVIAKTLMESCNFAGHRSVKEVKNEVTATVNKSTGLEVEYFDIVDGFSLQSIDNWDKSDYIVGCIAVFAGNVRLIDNIIYKKK